MNGTTDAFRERARDRAREEREVVEWAIAELDRLRRERDVDLEPLLEYARESQKSLPERHRAAYEGMAEVLDVDPNVYEAYAFAYSGLCEALGGPAADGCTNVLVAPLRTETGGSLVLKNRDIAGRGVRPKAIVEQPPIGEYHGFLTVDTAGTVAVYKGVNDAGLVAANTYVDVGRSDVDPAVQLRNGTAVRRILEECASVREARRLLEAYPTHRLMAQTLFLADAEETILLEVDPVAERIRAVDEPLVVRTNHFVSADSPASTSSIARRERALELLEGSADSGTGASVGEGAEADGGRRTIGRADLWSVARDHENGPGDESVCRHPEPETDEPYAFGQLTTASGAVFEGGEPTIDVVMGNPCEAERTRCALGEEIPTDLRTGQRWLDRVLAGREEHVAVGLPA
ncbi:C45 family autoproteolytic acyltransferase/hydrolase [Natrialbaceae archaeon GCM10025810]|uniref:C45 family autoproteolytic acyltransferase/hydolase n=1 Tax=Halovalidus salilacus TaxID=3075124 RepID=UPI00360CA4B8